MKETKRFLAANMARTTYVTAYTLQIDRTTLGLVQHVLYICSLMWGCAVIRTSILENHVSRKMSEEELITSLLTEYLLSKVGAVLGA